MDEIRIVGPGKTRGYPYSVCKKIVYITSCSFRMAGITTLKGLYDVATAFKLILLLYVLYV